MTQKLFRSSSRVTKKTTMQRTSHQTHSRFDTSTAAPDEVQPFIKESDVSITTHTSGNGAPPSNKQLSQPSADTSKLGADTFAGAAMIIIGTTMYGIFGILSRLSMLGNNSTPYQSAAAMVVAEFGKFVVSFFLLFHGEGIQQAIRSLKAVPVKEWLLFSIPAALYSITNNLDFYILQYMDPGSMQVQS